MFPIYHYNIIWSLFLQRFHVELFPKDPQFWEKVDLTLTKYRKVAKSEADLTAWVDYSLYSALCYSCQRAGVSTYASRRTRINTETQPSQAMTLSNPSTLTTGQKLLTSTLRLFTLKQLPRLRRGGGLLLGIIKVFVRGLTDCGACFTTACSLGICTGYLNIITV